MNIIFYNQIISGNNIADFFASLSNNIEIDKTFNI